MSSDDVIRVKAALTDVTRVLDDLGILGEGRARQRQSGGWVIRCPVHEDRTPSCSVQLRDGALLWNCHGCGEGGDVLDLIAAVRGINRGSRFRDVLLEGARLAGDWDLVTEIEAGQRERTAQPPPIRRPEPEPAHEREYPNMGEVADFWQHCGFVGDDPEAAELLRSRAIDPDAVDALELARSIRPKGALPSWARCRGGSWREAGYRLIVPMFDHQGELRSVRGWRVTESDLPKRLPPSGHRASGLVMADEFGRAMLRGSRLPYRVVIAEGEPNFATLATRNKRTDTCVLGIVSGSWNAQLAAKIPLAARVAVRVDFDDAGNRYFAEIATSLSRRAFIYRSREAST
jgi:hypothetical protein